MTEDQRRHPEQRGGAGPEQEESGAAPEAGSPPGSAEEQPSASDQPDQAEAAQGGERDEGVIPLEEREAPDHRAAPSLSNADAWRDACPNCGADLPSPETVLCMRCGYDMVANKVRDTRVGAAAEAESEQEEGEPGEFFRPGRLGWRAPVASSVALIIAATILAGVNAEQKSVVMALVTLFYAPVHATLGLGAAVLTARLLEDRVGRLDLGAARMLLATALFLACFHAGQTLETHPFLQWMAGAGVGAALYYGWAWWSLSVTRTVALMVGGFHFVFWLALSGLLWLQRLAAAPVVEETINNAPPALGG